MHDPTMALRLPLYRQHGATFPSADAYGHLVSAAADAKWTPLGWAFDGTGDELSITNPPALRFTGDFTLECLIRPAELKQQGIIARWVGADLSWLLGMRDAGGTLQLRTSPNGVAISDLFGVGALAAGNWYHVLATKIGATGYIYINGIQDTSGALDAAPFAGAGDCIIADWGGFSINYNGLIAYVAAWRRGMYPLEAQRRYVASQRWMLKAQS